MVLAQEEIWDQSETPKIYPHFKNQLIFGKGAKMIPWRQDNIANKWENYLYLRKYDTRLVSPTVHKNHLVDPGSKFKPEAIKLLGGKL